MNVNSLIYTVRGIQVMLDSDLAELFEVETKVFNQAVKRNINRFPDNFRFQLTRDEFDILRSQNVTLKIESKLKVLRSQNVTSSEHGGRRYLPYVFTEQGVAMLTGVIRSEIAIEMSIKIMTAFVEMRRFISKNALLIDRINTIETRQLMYQNESNEKFNQLFNALQSKDETKKESIFFDGQIYDAYSFIIKLIKKAKADITLIDNFVDNSVLDMLSKKEADVNIRLITHPRTKLSEVDIQKFNEQYPNLIIEYSEKFHDRFLLIDNKELYHIGASLKDLGKKCFAFSVIEDKNLLQNLIGKI